MKIKMPRKEKSGQKPIKNFLVYHGYDIDTKNWFVEIQIPDLGIGSIIKWFYSKSDYERGLRKVLWTIYN
jgi:hypothetical protein